MAATYAHATAPLRRLADRYVIEAALADRQRRPVPDDIAAAFGDLPAAMAKGEQRANGVERAVIDLAEAVLLSGRVGEVFDAVVVDEDRRGASSRSVEPAVLARVSANGVEPGDPVRVKLDARRSRCENDRVLTNRLILERRRRRIFVRKHRARPRWAR